MPLFFIIIFLIAPVITLPLCFLQIYQKNKYALYFPPIFLSCWSALIPPIGDQNRYFYLIDTLRDTSFYSLLQLDSDLNIITILCYIAGNLRINLELLRILITMFDYFVVISIFRALTDEKQLSQKDYFMLYCIMLLSFPYIQVCYGFRFGSATICFAGGFFYLLIASKIKTGVLLLVASMLFHFAFYFYIPFVAVFSLCKKIYKSKWIYIALIAFVMTINQIILSYGDQLFHNIPFLYTKYNAYFIRDAYWANGFLDDLNFYGKSMVWIKIAPALFLFAVFFRMINQFKYNYVMLGMYLLAAICWDIPTMRSRILTATIPIGFTFIFYLYLKGNLSKKFILLFGLILFLCKGFEQYGDRINHDYKKEFSALLYPLPYIIFNRYDEEYIYRNISENGDFYINWKNIH